MKYIFDFDDVIFQNTKYFKPFMYQCLDEVGVPRDIAEPYYKTVRMRKFWLKELLEHFNLSVNLYQKILDPNIIPNFLNEEIVRSIEKIGKENCYILTHGGDEFQMDKIRSTGIVNLFREIIVVFSEKTGVVESICKKHSDEVVVFIDDKQKHFDALDMSKCPNLKTILFSDESSLFL